jgi:hypothetical protein
MAAQMLHLSRIFHDNFGSGAVFVIGVALVVAGAGVDGFCAVLG